MTQQSQTSPRPIPRAVLVAGAVAVLAALALIVPIALTVGAALASAISRYRDLVGLLLLAVGAALLLGLLQIVFAFGRRLSAQARQAEIVRLQNDQPIHIADVTLLATRLAPHALDRYYEVEAIRADRSQFPQLTSYHHAPRIEAVPVQPPSASDAPAQLTMQEPLTFQNGKSRLAQMRERGHVCRSGRSLLVGYDPAGQPLYIELAECGFIAVAGQPRVGKSTLVTLLLAQAALSGWHIALGDPHIHKDDGLINRCQPISGHCFRQAVTPDEIAALIRMVDKIGRARVNGDADRTPVLMVIDEFSNFVIRKLLPDDVLAALPAMAMEYAGVGVHGVIIGHEWSRNLLGGDLGAALRRAITHRLVCRSDAGNAEFLLPSSALARQAAGLPKGQALYWGPESPAVVAVPWLGMEDMTYAAQGRPPRPYAPRLAAPAPTPARTLPPTTRVAPTPAPPTEPLPPPTVQEQIVDLLAARSWLTSSAIATTLSLDVKVVQTELKDLLNKRRLVRRPTRQGSDRYEYSTTQPLNALNLTPSA